MIPVVWIRVALAVGAILLFILGAQTGDDNLRWIAIAFLAVALVLRFVGRRK